MEIMFENVTKLFDQPAGEVLVLDDVCLSIGVGEFVVLLGPSGCGKTTLLKMLGGFEFPSFGRVLVDGGPVGKPGPDRGTIFQAPTLFPWLSVMDNVLYGPRMRGAVTSEDRARAQNLLNVVGLAGFEQFRPSKLSGGMQQRAAIARALINDPAILLADEPFAALDEYTRRAMQELFMDAISNQERATLFVTHSVEEAVFLADRIVVMTPRPGRIRTIIDVPASRPRDRSSREFLDLMGSVFDVIRHDAARAAA
jgi:ABC-type nitrate/sulfonate/bicarbonate transport system ATPase subunit